MPPLRVDSVSPAGIASLYDRLVADHYDEDAFGIIASSRAKAFTQMRALHALLPGLDVCDFGAGTGEGLLELDHEYPARAMWGVDVSTRMLDRARKKLLLTGGLKKTTLLESCATRAGGLVPPASIDIALSHFLLNYVDHAALADAVASVLRPGGLWSIVTSQRDSFPVLAELARMFLPKAYNPDRYCGVPTSIDGLMELVEDGGFEVVSRDSHTCSFTFDTFDHLLRFARHSGWFASDVVERVPDSEIAALRGDIGHMFPLADEARIAVLSCRRV